ncbi:MAG: hypothetical protein ABIQ11_07220 [Saprospiraceae bacterium]
MKWTFTIIALSLSIFYACSQSLVTKKVPDAVKAKFNKMYPNVSSPEWEMEDGKYEASFKENKLETAAVFNADGTLYQTENEIGVSDLPQSVSDYVASKFDNKKITGSTKIVSASGITTYEAEAGKTDYVFDANGQYEGVENEESGNMEEDD